MQIDVLGRLAVRLDPDSPPIPLPLAERSLLAMLATAGGRAVSADRLIDGLWGARLPADPVNALQVRVAKLRRRQRCHNAWAINAKVGIRIAQHKLDFFTTSQIIS